MGQTQPVPAPADPIARFVKNRRKALRWTAGFIAAAVLAGGGALAGIDLSNSGPAPAGQATVLSAALYGNTGAPARQAGKHPLRGLRMLRQLRGLHGEFTVAKKGGGFREIAFERGVVQAAGSSNIVVRAADGTTWTWTLTKSTAVIKNRSRSTAASISSGDAVFVGGEQNGNVRDARLIVVPAKLGTRTTAPGPGSPAPSAS